MRRFANALRPVGGFFHWWGSELFAMLPPPVRRLARAMRRPVYVLALGTEEAVLLRQAGTGAAAVLCAIDATLPGDRQAAELRRRLGRGRQPRIRLAAEQALRTSIRLPMAAEENLAEVVGFEVDRRTPFRAEDVHVTHRVEARDRGTKCLMVEMTVVPRGAVDKALAFAAQLGVTPGGVEVARQEPAVPADLLPRPFADEGARSRRRVAALAAVAAMLLTVAAATHTPADDDEPGHPPLARQVADARARAMEAAELRDRITELEARQRAASEAASLTANWLLAELTRLLPDDTWIDRLQLADGKLTISGQSAASARVMRVLEDSPVFDTPAFLAPVTQDPVTGMDSFSIATTVENPGK